MTKENIATIGEYHTYFSMASIIAWQKKPWVPFWLWKFFANPVCIGDDF